MDTATTGNSSISPSGPKAANHKANVTNARSNASCANTSPVTANASPSPKLRSSTTNAKTSPVTADANPSPKLRTCTTNAKTSPVTAKASPSPLLRSDATNAKTSAPNTGSIVSNDAKAPVSGAPKPGPRSDATKQMGAAELGKTAVYLDSFNTDFDTDLQAPSIEKRSRASMVQERRCLWRVKLSRRPSLRNQIEIRLFPKPTRSSARSLYPVVTLYVCSAALVPCSRRSSK